MRFLLIAVFFCFFSTQAGAWAVKGIGADYCGEVEESNFGYGQWMLGYISGQNFLFDEDVGYGVSGVAIIEAGFKFCRDNPHKQWADASQNIYEQLKNMQ